ncbi:synaptonemal complex central element protein 1-like [Melanerpes formicivorus]|uniref:synaptonemal complex central element protein 1-like n=1 Tax=Melanerpes formicivorus TaxID=211600 RepID=UPI00358E6A04
MKDNNPEGLPRAGPGLETLLGRIRSLQQAREAAAQELAAAQGHSRRLQQHLEQCEWGWGRHPWAWGGHTEGADLLALDHTVEEQQEALEKLWQQKQEALRAARLQREEVEAEGQRSLGLCLGRHQGLEGAGQQRSHLGALRRGYRKGFWEQLEAIMEEHKGLQEAHTPAQLELEVVKLEQELGKLLGQERLLMELEEQLGPAGATALRLVEQAREEAQQHLGAELRRREEAQARRDWLWAELQQLQRPLEAPLK